MPVNSIVVLAQTAVAAGPEFQNYAGGAITCSGTTLTHAIQTVGCGYLPSPDGTSYLPVYVIKNQVRPGFLIWSGWNAASCRTSAALLIQGLRGHQYFRMQKMYAAMLFAEDTDPLSHSLSFWQWSAAWGYGGFAYVLRTTDAGAGCMLAAGAYTLS